MSWFNLSSLSGLTAVAAESLNAVKESMNMDKLQGKFGVDKVASARAGLDLTYLTPRLIGADGWGVEATGECSDP